MPKKKKEKIDIDVMPYLSIMVCTLNLICLILIVTVMRIALNPHQLSVVSFEGLYQGSKGLFQRSAKPAAKATPSEDGSQSTPSEAKVVAAKTAQRVIKVPSYIECSPDSIALFPGEGKTSLAELGQTNNPVVALMDKIQANHSNEYVIVLVRPNSVPTYRYVRRLASKRNIDVGYDVLDADSKIDWKKEARALNIQLQTK